MNEGFIILMMLANVALGLVSSCLMADKGWRWAIAAGSAAAGSAVAARLSSSSMRSEHRLVLYAAVIGANVLMWSCYTRSLQTLSSLQATVVNFAANFLLSGFAGFFFFGEALHAQWFVGACLIVLGILVLSKAEIETKDASTGKQD